MRLPRFRSTRTPPIHTLAGLDYRTSPFAFATKRTCMPPTLTSRSTKSKSSQRSISELQERLFPGFGRIPAADRQRQYKINDNGYVGFAARVGKGAEVLEVGRQRGCLGQALGDAELVGMQQRLEPRDEQNLGDPVVIPRLGRDRSRRKSPPPPIDPRARAPAFVRAHEDPDRAARRRSANHGREPRKRSDASSAFFRKGPFRLGYDRKGAAHRDPPSKAKDVRDRHEYYGADIK